MWVAYDNKQVLIINYLYHLILQLINSLILIVKFENLLTTFYVS